MLDSLDGQISDAMQAITIDAVLPEAEPRSGSTVSAPPETSLEGVPADIQAWLRGRCRVALAKIVENNRPRIAAMARRRAASPEIQEDLISVGVIAMMHALERYEPRPGIPFFAYAAPYIRAAMAKEATFSLSIVDIPERHLRDARAGQMDADAAALVHESRYVTDIDDLHEVTPSSSAVTAETALSQKQISAQLRHHFRQALEQLSKEEAEVIRWRAAGGGEIRTLAERLDITADKVRKIEFRAMARMKSFLLRQGVTPHILNTAT